MTAEARPLSGLRFSLVGAGTVGGTLAGWLVASGAEPARVAGRAGSARTAAAATRLGARLETLESLSSDEEDLLLVAVSDAAIAPVATALSVRPQAPVALHLSGALGASALAPLAAGGSATGTFHPLRAFSAGNLEAEPVAGVFYALDGVATAVALGRRLAAAFGGTSEVIPESTRPLYHLAATLFAGGIATVASAACELRRTAGLPAAADAGYARLATDALAAALAADEPARAITGPAVRGDQPTFLGEARALGDLAPGLLPLVLMLGREALRQRARIEPLNPAQRALLAALESPDLLDPAGDRVLAFPPGRDG